MKIAFKMLGCPKNDVDAEVMIYQLREAGHDIVTNPAVADAIVVNTCGFIKDAKDESVDAILEMAEYKKSGSCQRLIVTGCLSQRYNKQLFDAIPEVDLMIGVNEYDRIVSLVEGATGDRVLSCSPDPASPFIPGRAVTTPKHYAYLKIAEGCSNRCAYCAIPAIRGPYRSRDARSIVQEAEILTRQGAKELILIAQDTTRYGVDLKDGGNLVSLIKALTEVEGVERIRPLYCYPELVTDDLLELVGTHPKVCRYLDIPLQHIDDGILKAMNRRSNEEQIRALIQKIRAKYDIALRTTFIVGFPGETEEQFENLLHFIQEARFENMGAFVYSPEEGTPAYKMRPRVQKRVAERRRDRLMLAQQQISAQLLAAQVGSVQSVLIDGTDEDGMLIGRTGGQAPDIDGITYVQGGDASLTGMLIQVKISDSTEYDLRGTML